MSQIEDIGEADPIEVVAPLVIDTTVDRVTHIDLVHEDTHHYIGWNPATEQWEQLLVVDETEEELTVVSVIGVAEETESRRIQLASGDHPEISVSLKRSGIIFNGHTRSLRICIM
jgi:hypothetical protein